MPRLGYDEIIEDAWKPSEIENPIPIIPVDWKSQYDNLFQDYMVLLKAWQDAQADLRGKDNEISDLKWRIEYLTGLLTPIPKIDMTPMCEVYGDK